MSLNSFFPGLLALAATLAALFAASPAGAAVRYFAYIPADQTTRDAAGDLTFGFRQRLIFTTVLNVRSSDGAATADLKPAADSALGPGGLTRLVGREAGERELYEVTDADQGSEMIRAFCPGSRRAWLAIGKLSMSERLKVDVLGDDPGSRGAHLCRSLAFDFEGEWRLPTSGRGVPFRDLKFPSHGPLGTF
jgi:hypothetical protein